MVSKHIPLEKTITNNILKYLNALPRCRARKMPSGPYGSGWPDIICVLDGEPVFIEVKRPKVGKLTKLQDKELNDWQHVGAHTMVATSVDEVRDELYYCGLIDDGPKTVTLSIRDGKNHLTYE